MDPKLLCFFGFGAGSWATGIQIPVARHGERFGATFSEFLKMLGTIYMLKYMWMCIRHRHISVISELLYPIPNMIDLYSFLIFLRPAATSAIRKCQALPPAAWIWCGEDGMALGMFSDQGSPHDLSVPWGWSESEIAILHATLHVLLRWRHMHILHSPSHTWIYCERFEYYIYIYI